MDFSSTVHDLVEPLTTLNSSSEILLLIEAEGSVIWSSAAAVQFFGTSPIHLNSHFTEGDFAKMLAPQRIHTCSLEVKTTKATKTMTMLRIEVGSGEPGEERFLVFLTQGTPHESRETREKYAIASVAHDIKNPLSAVLGYSELLLDTSLGQNLPHPQREILSKIRSTALRSLDLVKNYQILFQAKEAGISRSKTLTNVNLSLEATVQSLWREDEEIAPLSLELYPDPLSVYVDPIFLDRIFSNLIGNALKYTCASGKIRVQSKLSSYGIEVHIINTAPIITREEKKRLFLPYERGAQQNQVPGSGLGLYIVKTIIDAIGASITVTTSDDPTSTSHSSGASDSSTSTENADEVNYDKVAIMQGNDFCVTFPEVLRG